MLCYLFEMYIYHHYAEDLSCLRFDLMLFDLITQIVQYLVTSTKQELPYTIFTILSFLPLSLAKTSFSTPYSQTPSAYVCFY